VAGSGFRLRVADAGSVSHEHRGVDVGSIGYEFRGTLAHSAFSPPLASAYNFPVIFARLLRV
jgi:hypothetical protein